MRNFIYQRVDTEQLDGLVIWTSALAGNASLEEIAGFHQIYSDVPIVDLASLTKSGPMVTIDDKQGMRALLLHLIKERGLQSGRDFQAVVVASDLQAIGAIRLMTERGVQVPMDVAAAGFNDSFVTG